MGADGTVITRCPGDNRGVTTRPSAHYFTNTPQSPDARRFVEFTHGGREYRMASSSAVFSADRLDPGTAVLLRKAPPPPGRGTLLDLGCGYGAIACALAGQAPHVTVYAVDVNSRARELAAENAARHGFADRMVVCAPDDVPADVVFDEIWSNPPIRIGKAALHEMLRQWLPRLAPDGTAWLVVARNLGADSLQTWLTNHGWPTERHASQKGYRILSVTPAAPDSASSP